MANKIRFFNKSTKRIINEGELLELAETVFRDTYRYHEHVSNSRIVIRRGDIYVSVYFLRDADCVSWTDITLKEMSVDWGVINDK